MTVAASTEQTARAAAAAIQSAIIQSFIFFLSLSVSASVKISEMHSGIFSAPFYIIVSYNAPNFKKFC